jgi:hypothetical protein
MIQTLCIVLGLFLGGGQGSAKQEPAAALTAAEKNEVIATAIKELNDAYIFADVAKKMEQAIRKRQTDGEYEKITSGQAFAETLTANLQEVSKDKHLRVRYSSEPFGDMGDGKPTADEIKRMAEFEAITNYGFERVERLQGNIGYLKLRGFQDAKLGKDTVAAAMKFLSNTDALVIDLRENGGGSPEMVALICSYFFAERTHLNDLYYRREDKTEQYWTNPKVSGKKFLDKDIYVLTSSRTFSAAEEFSYNLQTQKRATIVGETTGGGAHPGEFVKLGEHFGMFLPSGRAINAVTKTNWEGIGVKPDVACNRDEALKRAHILAAKKLLPNTKNEMLKDGRTDIINKLEAELKGG